MIKFQGDCCLSIESNSCLLWFCITSLSRIGLKNSRHILNQSAVKAKTKTFFRASCRLHLFSSYFDCFTGLSVTFVSAQSVIFGNGFTKRKQKSLQFW